MTTGAIRRRGSAAARLNAAATATGVRRFGLCALIALAALTPFGGPGAQTLDLLPAKATYLHMLAHFVVWPARAFASPNAPFVICVQGTDPFQTLLDRTVAGQRVGERPLQVARIDKLDAASGCQIVYVAGSPAQSRAQALDAARGAPILTVTDVSTGPGPEGIVHFVLAGGRVRFEIDKGLAKASGLTLSSKLLALAVRVTR